MKHVLLIIMVFSSLQSCRVKTDDDVSIEFDCPSAEILKSTRYSDLPNSVCTVSDYKLVGNALTVSLGLSGCNFQRRFSLVIDEAKSKSMPPQQNAKLVFDEQACQAFFEFDICFDVSKLDRPTVLNLPYKSGVRSIEIN